MVDKVIPILWIVKKIKPRNILSVDYFIQSKKITDVIQSEEHSSFLKFQIILINKNYLVILSN